MRLILNAFAYISGYASGANIEVSEEVERRDVYLKNSCVSLVSAKRNNRECDVALCTNIEKLPDWCQEIFNKEEIKVYYIPYDRFRFESNMKWSLAFYKLCALEYMLENHEYEAYCLIDVDCYVNHSLQDMWLESENTLLMYNTFDTFSSEMRKNIALEFAELYPEQKPRTWEYYAGGEIAGSRTNIKKLLGYCNQIWNDMMTRNVRTKFGDEFFWFTVDKLDGELIKPGNGYFEHYWTYKGFFLISTNYHYRSMPVLHFPSEKNRGILKVFRYYQRKGELPKDRILWHLIGLPQPDGQNYAVVLAKIWIKKILRK